jgi:hypothetical protein
MADVLKPKDPYRMDVEREIRHQFVILDEHVECEVFREAGSRDLSRVDLQQYESRRGREQELRRSSNLVGSLSHRRHRDGERQQSEQ